MARAARLAVLLLCSALARPAHSASSRLASPEELIRLSDMVAVVDVVSTRSIWDRRMLVTLVELRVVEAMKGRPAETTTLLLPGGTDEERGIAAVVPGVPQVAIGSRMLLFGAANPLRPDTYLAVGLAQGMLLLSPAAATPAPGGIEIVGGDAGASGGLSASALAQWRARIAATRGARTGKNR
jgi:hypothetical protein